MNESGNKDELEQYLQQQASEHRMYPSDFVWKNIRKKIHTPKRWPALSVFTVFIISALVVGTVLNKPVPDTVTANFHFTLQSPAVAEVEKASNTVAGQQQPLADEHYSPEQLTKNTIIEAVEKTKIDNAVALQMMQNDNASFAEMHSANNIVPNIDVANAIPGKTSLIKNNQTAVANTTNENTSLNNIDFSLFNISSRLKGIFNTNASHTNKSGGVAFFLPRNNNTVYDNFEMYVKPTHVETIPLALEQLGKKSSRFDFRFYVTPSISYRRLKEKTQISTQVNTVSVESSYKVKPSQAINQSPAVGYETGFGLGYALTNKLTLTGGFQFNISQYKIDAFLYKDEPAVVTLGEGKFSNNINTVSSLRSIPGTKPLTINNRYYQISMPLGIDWMAWNNNRFSFGFAGAIQPTYTFDKQPLIITSNYKNYADGFNYVRNWNINANIESYFGYTTGSYRWQIGPQFRYQVLPSLVDKYPNKEYLFNYGLKVGVVKHLK